MDSIQNNEFIWDKIRPNLNSASGQIMMPGAPRLQIIHESERDKLFLASPNKYFSEYVKNNFFPIIEEELAIFKSKLRFVFAKHTKFSK